MKDYYYILGVATRANDQEIKAAYRKLSLKFHPDKNEGDPFFEERFKEINEACEVLGNPVKKQLYDSKTGNVRQPTAKPTKPVENIAFLKINVNSNSIFHGDIIRLSWTSMNFEDIQIEGRGRVENSGSRQFVLNKFFIGNKAQFKFSGFNQITRSREYKLITIEVKRKTKAQKVGNLVLMGLRSFFSLDARLILGVIIGLFIFFIIFFRVKIPKMKKLRLKGKMEISIQHLKHRIKLNPQNLLFLRAVKNFY